jgi:hypothetical protein
VSAAPPTSTAAGHQPDDVLAQRLELLGEQRANRRIRLTGVMVVEEIGRFHELRLGVRAFGVQDPVLHIALRGHDDQQHAALRQAQELDVAERRLGALGRHDDAREMGELREQRPGGSEQLLRPVGGELALETVDLALLERFHDHQAIDEEPVTLRRRHAARRGVRARDVTQLLEIRHDVANRRRRELQPGLPRQNARADRQTVDDEPLDQRLEQILCTGIQHAPILQTATVGGSPQGGRGGRHRTGSFVRRLWR